MTKAKDLVAVGMRLQQNLAFPIVNKRVSVTPISIIGAATECDNYVPFAKALDRGEGSWSTLSVASQLWFKKATKGDKSLINSIPRTLAETDLSALSVNIGSTKTGINMTAVRDMES